VWLLDGANYSKYSTGQEFTRSGGFAKHSPVRFLRARAGKWHLLIDQDDDTTPVISIIVKKADQ
jgi:hypothetical protein